MKLAQSSPAALALAVITMALMACAGQPAASPAAAPAETPAAGAAMSLEQAIAAPTRSEKNTARDKYRHPRETLEFFGVSAGQTVVEVWPGAGWYTEILAPYLRESGRYYAAQFAINHKSPPYRANILRNYKAKLAANPELYGRAIVTELGGPDRWEACPPGSADRVLTFRNVHNWIADGEEQQMFAAFYKALKSGGVLGVVEHRAMPGTSIEKMKESGYVTEAYVIELAAQAGFKLEARSEINANSRDSHEHPEGVWTLPPALRLGDRDREKYLAIGESDRMTLRFVKP